jgi:hypothetical protein
MGIMLHKFLGDVVAQWIERQTASVVVPGSNLGIS